MKRKITVEIVYAMPNQYYLKQILLEEGATIEQAILSSSLLRIRNDINLNINKIGVYGKLVALTDIVKDGDRIEIYRPLIADPRELRRQRIKKH